MEIISISGLTLYFDPDEKEAADLIARACEKSARLIYEQWGKSAPQDCRVYVMTSWLHFVFHSAPWPRKVLMALTLPLWAFQTMKLWPYAGGWSRKFGKRWAVGVKPPRLIQLGDSSIGERIFMKQENVRQKVEHVTCHELVHAFTDHLNLPTWMHEGLAMLTVDRYAGAPTVRNDTLDVVAASSQGSSPGGREPLQIDDRDATIYQYVRGYWLVRYIEEIHPGLLKDMLVRPLPHDELEGKIAAAYGMERDAFWGEVDHRLATHFMQG
jgi:hypothetical protein